MRRWNSASAPLPVRHLRPAKTGWSPLLEAPPWYPTGPHQQPFDFCGHVRRLLHDIALRCSEFSHIDVSRVLLGIMQARHHGKHGLQARVTPLRFPHGELTRIRRGVTYQIQRYFLDEHEFLYVMTFCLPRFLDRDFDDKMVTLVHELYHIGPHFNGDLRRHGGRYQLHSHSKKRYDEHMTELARAYLATRPDSSLHAFLRLNFAQLVQRHGAVAGVVVPRPRIVPLLQAGTP